MEASSKISACWSGQVDRPMSEMLEAENGANSGTGRGQHFQLTFDNLPLATPTFLYTWVRTRQQALGTSDRSGSAA
jgi:hypothetical protein